jgi:N-acetylglucosaminyldiphosphoundecaprenol N-acetyl-beta-D-mannosaminyltransferase
MQGMGLEWIWRIREEPRLIKRYARDGLFLLRLVFLSGLVLQVLRLFSGRPSAASASYRVAPDGSLGVCIRGNFSAESAEQIDLELKQQVPAAGAVWLDLSEIRDIDTRGLGILYAWRFRRGWHVRIAPAALQHWRTRLKFRLHRARVLLAPSE